VTGGRYWSSGIEIIGLIISHQNVIEMKNTQKELETSKRLLQAILDNLVDGILTFNEDGEIQSVNRAGAYIFGYAADEMIGQNIRTLIPSLAAQSENGSIKTVLDRFNGLGDELEGRRKDGSTFPIYFATNKVNLDHHKLYTATIQDFTERKFMEKS